MSTDAVCQICLKDKFKYTCPKCNIPYCSVACYKAAPHLKCSEEFYKNCIQEEITTAEPPNSHEDMRKIYEILKRIRETDAGVDEGVPPQDFNDGLDSDDDQPATGDDVDDDENEEDISTRLQGVDINDSDEVWQRLTTAERQEFQQMIECGDIMKLLPNYKPWWTKQKHSKIVVLPSKEETASDIPKVLPNIPKFTDICKKTPSSCLHYNLWNILAAYACTVRFFAGEHLITPGESAAQLVNLSSTLKYGTNFEDAEDAIISVEMEGLTTGNGAAGNVATPVLVESREQLQGDARQLLSTRHFKLAALSDILQLLLLAKRQARSAKVEQAELQKLFALCAGSVELSSSKLQQLSKKMEFLLSYVNRESSETV